MEKNCLQRIKQFEPRPNELRVIKESVSAAMHRLAWHSIANPKVKRKPLDFRHTRLAYKDEEAEVSIIAQTEIKICNAAARRDADFFIKFSKMLEAESGAHGAREGRHPQRLRNFCSSSLRTGTKRLTCRPLKGAKSHFLRCAYLATRL